MPAFRLVLPVVAAMGLAIGAVGLSIGSARANDTGGIFDFLFHQQQQNDALPQTPQQAAPEPRRPAGPPALPTQRAYCVRTCDGYYFAVGFTRNITEVGQDQAMCAASCGSIPMRLYSAPVTTSGNGSDDVAINRAVDATGAPYTALPTANAFRNTDVPACTCQGTANGLPQIPLTVDPTLRNGDIVVMPDGLKVFRGSGPAPHDEKDFVGVTDAHALPNVVRQQMLSLQNRIAQ